MLASWVPDLSSNTIHSFFLQQFNALDPRTMHISYYKTSQSSTNSKHYSDRHQLLIRFHRTVDWLSSRIPNFSRPLASHFRKTIPRLFERSEIQGWSRNHDCFGSVTATEQRVASRLFRAVGTDADVRVSDVGRLLERNAETFGTHRWSALFHHDLSVQTDHRIFHLSDKKISGLDAHLFLISFKVASNHVLA